MSSGTLLSMGYVFSVATLQGGGGDTQELEYDGVAIKLKGGIVPGRGHCMIPGSDVMLL